MENSTRRGRGRPPGPTPKGFATREALYRTAVRLITEQGYEATTMREIADSAGVSPGLLYRYFPGKRAVVLALYDELSAEYAVQARKMKPGSWRERSLFAMETSLRVLGTQRSTLAALVSILVGDSREGLFAPGTAFSRRRVQQVFIDAVRDSTEEPADEDAESLGRVLYVIHLAVILWWLLDKSPAQRATTRLLGLLGRLGSLVAVAWRLPGARRLVRTLDELVQDALLGVASDA